MRDYSHFDQYYSELLGDVYHQPIDDLHFKAMEKFVYDFVVPSGAQNVVDVGSGEGYMQKILEGRGIPCYNVEIENGEDFNFLGDFNCDMIISRHTLEHSPFPLITLMDWHRISGKWLALVLPNPEHYTYTGRNHYSVMNERHAAWLLRRAGWKMNKFRMDRTEIWFLCEKKPRVSYEGWAKVPVNRAVHEFERDKLTYGYVDAAYYLKEAE